MFVSLMLITNFSFVAGLLWDPKSLKSPKSPINAINFEKNQLKSPKVTATLGPRVGLVAFSLNVKTRALVPLLIG